MSFDNMSMGSDLPFLGPRSGPKSMELQQLSRRPKHHVSPTLGELLQLVGDANTPPNGFAHQMQQGGSERIRSCPFVLSLVT
ncbi:hypothetical protein OSB04_009648 [Centaurea solstitialis]|uniref:Uncharacterized protein n=1 Tax=Centaurea solstitialis TaxID=347529 RepID=A0AA38WMB9_9ASTR|nr:hypothetical protein OSB04_009648 [Centaurea solstitialis]